MKFFRTLASLPRSLWFNLRVLPFRQAVKLPIVLHKARLISTKGSIVIDAPVRRGMIHLGVNLVSIYPDSGIRFENKGTIIFHGSAVIGNDSAISVGKSGVIEIGDNFVATAGLKLVCYKNVRIEHDVLIGWSCMICDTDFHRVTLADGSLSKGYGSINIGHNTWIANGCKVYKNVTIPPECVVGADTILYKNFECAPQSLICNNRDIIIKSTSVTFKSENSHITYD